MLASLSAAHASSIPGTALWPAMEKPGEPSPRPRESRVKRSSQPAILSVRTETCRALADHPPKLRPGGAGLPNGWLNRPCSAREDVLHRECLGGHGIFPDNARR